MKKWGLFAVLALIPGIGWSPVTTHLNVEETDGAPSVFPYKLLVGTGTLTDNGDGTATLATGGGSGSGSGGGVTVPSTFTWSGVKVSTDFTVGEVVPILSTSAIQTATIDVTSASINGQLMIGSNLYFGLGSLGGLNKYSVRYRDVDVDSASSFWQNTGTFGWEQPLGTTNMTLIGNKLTVSTVTFTTGTVSGQWTVGTLQGASLATCGDTSHALGWSGGSFACQAISGSGGASSLAVAVSSVAVSSPTIGINFSPAFTGSLSAGGTTQVGLDGSSVTMQGNGITFTTLGAATGTLRTDVTAVGAATATLRTDVLALGVSTASLRIQVINVGISTNSLAVSTGSIAVDTGSIRTQVISVGVATDSIRTQVINVGISTNSLAVSTGSIAVDTGSIRAQVINVGVATATLRTDVTAVGAATATLRTDVSNLGIATATFITASSVTATYVKLTGTQTITGSNYHTSTATFSGQVFFSSSVYLNGSQGNNAQVFTSSGTGLPPYWGTPTSGGASALAVAVSSVQVSSPTVGINFSSAFAGALTAPGTAQISLAGTQTFSTATITYISASTITLAGTSNLTFIGGDGNYYQIIGSSIVGTKGQLPVFGSSNTIAISSFTNTILALDGNGVLVSTFVTGSGTPGGSNSNVQYNSGGSFAGSNKFQFNGTSVTIVGSSVSITGTQGSVNNIPGYVDILKTDAGSAETLFSVGSQSQNAQFYIANLQPANMSLYGAWAGGVKIGQNGDQKIVSQSRNNYFEVNALSTMTFHTDNDIGGGDMVFKPQTAEKFRVSAINGVTVGGSTLSVNGVAYQFPAGIGAGGVFSVNTSSVISFSAAGSGDAVLAATQTFTGTDTFISTVEISGQVFLSSNVFIKGSQGNNAQVLTSSGTGLPPYWGTVSAGSGDMILASTQTSTGGKTFSPYITVVGSAVVQGTMTITGNPNPGDYLLTIASSSLVGSATDYFVDTSGNTGQRGEARFFDTDGSHYAGFKATASMTTSSIWTLPLSSGTTSMALTNIGSNITEWRSIPAYYRMLVDSTTAAGAQGSSTTIQIPVLAGSTYYADCYMLFRTTVTTVGARFSWSVPTNSTISYNTSIPVAADGTAAMFEAIGSSTTDWGVSTAVLAVGTMYTAHTYGSFGIGTTGTLVPLVGAETGPPPLATTQVIVGANSYCSVLTDPR